jgi:hypothetical protein
MISIACIVLFAGNLLIVLIVFKVIKKDNLLNIVKIVNYHFQ